MATIDATIQKYDLLEARHITEALDYARGMDLEELRRRQQRWLRDGIPLLQVAIDQTFSVAIRRSEADANAIQCGAYMGSRVLQIVIDEERTTTEDCRTNVARFRVITNGFEYASTDPEDHLIWDDVFGPNNAAFEAIRNDHAREMCRFVTAVALATPTEPQA